jgi:hypothetical protein
MDISTEHPARSPRPSLFDWQPSRVVLLILLCAVLILRGRAMLTMSPSLRADPDAYRGVGRHIYQDHTIGLWREEFNMMTPTATRPPLYPLVLSAFNYLELPSWDADAALYGLLHVVLGTASVWLVWQLGLLWGLPPSAAILAAALFAIDPILINQAAQVMTETLATLLALLALLALTHGAQQGSLRWQAAAGALIGLGVLCRPTFLVWLALVALALFPLRSNGTHRFVRLAALVLAAAVVVAPWGLRNQWLFGRPVITTTHGGFTLLLANNPQFYEYLRSAPWGSVWDGEPMYRWWESSQRLIDTPAGLACDELDADQRAYAEAWGHIRDEPAMFAYSCLVRVGRLWAVFPHQISRDESASRRGLRYAVAIFYTLELALAAVGAWTLGRRLFRSPWIWGTLLLLSFTTVHALYWTDMRMRAPLVGVVVLLAAQGVLVLASRRPDAKPMTTAI